MVYHFLWRSVFFFVVYQKLALAEKNYPGGFTPDGAHCVDICANASATPTCFNHSDPHCTKKKQAPGDWDFLLLDMLYLPQFCRGLEFGVDDTVSHQHVAPYPNGTQCHPEQVTNALTIHGLWPNYVGGFPACCQPLHQRLPSNVPLDPRRMNATEPTLLQQMSEVWKDPTVDSAFDTLCEIHNHEFQKHGYCLGYGDMAAPVETIAARYFSYTMRVATTLNKATMQISKWAAEGIKPPLSDISNLFERAVQVICAKEDRDGAMLNRLASIRTCWTASGPLDHDSFWQIDCQPLASYGNIVPCSSNRTISLEPYVQPHAIYVE
ncbi:hypothetical protein CYMTET_47658 [Cymbomonas tetramitiformis]|uniref:Uncharacterized protein n=1 Tax=Cymbomonas tetramitiformis TaxID=36881 RepID=A0AAE0BTU6_9CHLO|nr:hypothetical protein CYMTET_47658 [Cymbomonas tetramitiformis]